MLEKKASRLSWRFFIFFQSLKVEAVLPWIMFLHGNVLCCFFRNDSITKTSEKPVNT